MNRFHPAPSFAEETPIIRQTQGPTPGGGYRSYRTGRKPVQFHFWKDFNQPLECGILDFLNTKPQSVFLKSAEFRWVGRDRNRREYFFWSGIGQVLAKRCEETVGPAFPNFRSV